MPVMDSAMYDAMKIFSDSGVKCQMSPTEIVLEIQTPGVPRGLLSWAIYNTDVLKVKAGGSLSTHSILAVRQMPKYCHSTFV